MTAGSGLRVRFGFAGAAAFLVAAGFGCGGGGDAEPDVDAGEGIDGEAVDEMEEGLEVDGDDGGGDDRADRLEGDDGRPEVPVTCGDGVVQPPEECDDGNTDDTDDCPGTCLDAACGDGFLRAGREECDDGNADDTDDCPTSCEPAACGDGFVWDGHEECDDGEENSDTEPDACREDCVAPACADGVQDTGEGCDDGNTDDGDGCSAACVLETCGDGELQAGEECDDGEENSDTEPDACRENCLLAYCGDGVTDGGETCDDGNLESGDGCSAECLSETCGNGVVDAGEECDDGNADNTDGCVADCREASCGDGYEYEGHEECDPGIEYDGVCDTPCGSEGILACDASCTFMCLLPPEACNGADDDCDTLTDDGFPCLAGTTVDCLTDCGSSGTGTCTASCQPPSGAGCTAPAEECNGADDDCDTLTDDGFPCAAGTAVDCRTWCGSTGSGTCSATCALPGTADCAPPAEACNAADDDCDTVPDNGLPCVQGTSTTCSTTCRSTGSGTCGTDCSLPTGAACAAPPETCNGADDDCDTVPDDGFPCVAGSRRPCTASSCTGEQVCDATACLWAACDFGAAPPDDACSGALLDVSAGGRFAGSTCAANNDYTYSCGPTLAASGDVVFQLVLPGTRDVVIGTEGSDFDAVLFIRRGATCPGGTAERCDDNAAGGGQARITWTGMPAGTYWVILDGAGSGSYGNYVLNVWVSAAPPPANDTCGTAIVMRDSGTFAGTTLGATDDNAASCAPGTGGRDVWYSFTLGGRELVYLDLVDGNSWNSVLEVRRGSCPAPATVAACNDDACGGQRSQWFGPLDSGTTYYVVVDGAGASASGNFSLFFQHAPCAGATLLPASGDYDGSTAGAANDHAGGCGGRTAGEDDYYFGLCGSRTVAATTCNSASDFDTVLYLRQGSCFAGDLACNNDADPACVVSDTLSAVSATMGKGLGFLMVDGYYGDEGDYRVTVSGL